MSNLQTLEETAVHLENMLRISPIPQAEHIEVEGKSAEQLKLELDRLNIETEQRITYFKERVEELEALLDKPINLTSSIAIGIATEIITDIHKVKKFIELDIETIQRVNNTYGQRQLIEAGFDSYDAVSEQINNLETQRSALRQRFLSRLRFKRQIRDLNSRIRSLYDLSNTQYPHVRLPEIDYLENLRFEDALRDVFERFANELFSQYKTIVEQLSMGETASPRISPAILKSLTYDYISKYFFKSEIEKELEANKKQDDYYERRVVEVLENSQLVNEALAVLRDGLNQYHILRFEEPYTEDQDEKTRAFKSRLETLPYSLRNLVETGIYNDKKTINKMFSEFEDYLTQLPIDIEKKRILTSLSRAKQHILRALSGDDLPYSITSQRWDLERIAEEIETSLKSKEKDDYLKDLDMGIWDVFRNNVDIQQIYGRDALDSFDQLINDEVFNRLLVTPEGSDASVNLGYKALWFKDPNAIVYNLLNFWREQGGSGEQPFLSIHTSSENTLGAQYITSLTEEQLRAVEQLRIPGLIDVISIIRQHPDIFNQYQLKEGDECIDNPVYERVQEALGNVCDYYLKYGSEEEKYFVVGVTVNLGFMRFSDKPSKQRDLLIEVLSEQIGLDNHVQANFKNHYRHFLDRLSDSTKRSSDLHQYKEDLMAISKYYDDLDILLAKCINPNRVIEEANSMQNNYYYIHEVTKDLPKLIAYLRGFDSEIVQAQLADPEYNGLFKTRLLKVKEQIFRRNTSIEDVYEYVIANFTAFKLFIYETNKLIERSAAGNVLRSEQERLLDDLVYSGDLVGEIAHIPEYFRALDDNIIARMFAGMDVQAKKEMEFLARTAYNCDKTLVVPLIREAIGRDATYEQLSHVQSYLLQIAEFSGFVSACTNQEDNQKELFDLLYELSIMGEDSLRLVAEVDRGNLDLKTVQNSIKKLGQNRIRPTSYLVKRLAFADNRDKTIGEWLSEMDSFAQGYFDSTNELHRNLEYTKFRAIVDHEKVRKHMKNHFTFTDYLLIFDKTEEMPESLMTEQDRFEIDCIAEEAKVLRDYVLSVKQRADELGKEVLIVPNLSYGYLPVSPIVEELEHVGINTIIGVKVGSTESHNNKEVVDSSLFKGYRTKIAYEQPIIIVVDGTKHLVARDDQDKAARYPDAYQGYLNQVVAMNDAMGFTEVDYSNAGKTTEDMVRLRQTPEFQRLVDVYKHVIKPDAERERKPYQFGLWNTAGIDLIIRNYHQRIGYIAPTTPEEIQGPAMIFCNVGLLDEQIPQKLRDKYNGLTHIPAYYDDSGKIINFDFRVDNFGVRYLNTLETEIKKAFGSMHSKLSNGDFVSSLIRYVQNRPAQPVGYEA
ncbi:MAG: hypothetical protein ACTSU7_09710 [Candidatus Heimdallarchaeaceae archaeon]